VKTALFSLVIFLSGVVVGGGLTLHILWKRLVVDAHRPEVVASRITNRMTRRLDLTPEQREKVAEIIKKRQEHFQRIRRRVRPRVWAELEGARQEINGVLTPEQAEKFNRHFEHVKKRWLEPALGP
jgi:hypothetical protein